MDRFEVQNRNLMDGLSGLMRIRNEETFVKDCINSCIDALDELIIVYNDCTDNTPQIVREMQKLYPRKIRVYAYDNNVLSHNLTKEEFEYAKSLPDDSPRLHCNQCNFALSKANYKYAVKIDADQLYFSDELKKWRDVCSGDANVKWNICFILGWFFMMYFTFYKRLSFKVGKPCLWMLSDWLCGLFVNSYLKLAKWRLRKGTVAIALSGFNVFKDNEWYIPFDGLNIHPPYNGEGDTLIFRVSAQTYYSKTINEATRTITEHFNCPYKMMFVGPIWFHLHANRYYCWSKVKETKEQHPNWFVPIELFSKMSYKEVYAMMDKKAHSLYQRTLFALVHKIGIGLIKKHLVLLQKMC